MRSGFHHLSHPQLQLKANLSRDYYASERVNQLRGGTGRKCGRVVIIHKLTRFQGNLRAVRATSGNQHPNLVLPLQRVRFADHVRPSIPIVMVHVID